MQLQELKQRASGNLDEPFLSPGINEKQPLHVMMVKSLFMVPCKENNVVQVVYFLHGLFLFCTFTLSLLFF